MINWIKNRVGERTSWDGGESIVTWTDDSLHGYLKSCLTFDRPHEVWTIWKSE